MSSKITLASEHYELIETKRCKNVSAPNNQDYRLYCAPHTSKCTITVLCVAYSVGDFKEPVRPQHPAHLSENFGELDLQLG